MHTNTREPQQLEDVRNFVRKRICELHGLVVEAFEMTERRVLRGGRICGVYFCVHGPRSVKLTAIWDNERNTAIFYGSAGQRIEQAELWSPSVSLPGSEKGRL